jgi:Tfp pilus assembly protein PilO
VKVSLGSLSPRALIAIAAGAVLLWTIVLWLLYVSPHRSSASAAKADLEAARAELLQAQVGAHRPSALGGSAASDVLRLTKAMPSGGDGSSLVLELSRLARVSHVELRSISSQTAADGPGGTTVIPVTVTVGGRFTQITRFLLRTRRLVSMRHGRVRAKGRLFSAQSIELAESLDGGFPNLDATIVLNAFVYNGPITPVIPAQSPGTTDTTSSGTSAAPGGSSS